MRRGWRFIVCGLFLAVLVGCAGPSSETTDSGVVNVRQGRFTVVTKSVNEAEQAVHGNFVWRRKLGQWQLDLSTPLGTTLARVTVTPGGAALEQPNQMVRRASSASALVSRVFGAPVPLDAIEDWIEGRVVEADVQDVTRDSLGRISGFSQAGWRVRFERYGERGPNLLGVSGRQGERDIQIRLTVDRRVP